MKWESRAVPLPSHDNHGTPWLALAPHDHKSEALPPRHERLGSAADGLRRIQGDLSRSTRPAEEAPLRAQGRGQRLVAQIAAPGLEASPPVGRVSRCLKGDSDTLDSRHQAPVASGE